MNRRGAGLPSLTRLLQWSKNRESLALLSMVKVMSEKQPEDIAPVLKEVVRAAETADTAYLPKDALAALESLKQRGPDSWRNMAVWGQVGEGAIALGCLGAAVSGVATAVGIPCVVGGALASAGLKMIAQP